MTKVSKLIRRHKAGRALERAFYCDAEVFELELERIFLRSWLYAGHVSQIPNHGDFFLFEAVDESVIVVRQRSGEIRGLLNVCRHRGSRVCLESSGNAKKLVCPYHAWVYDLDGALASARHAEGDVEKAELGLRPLQVRVFHGMIFVNFDESAKGFDAIERDLDVALAPYGLADAKVAHEASYTIRANWKLAVENYCECYHCRPAHPEYSLAHSLADPEERNPELWAAVADRAAEIGLVAEHVPFRFGDEGGFGNERMYEHYPLLDGFASGSRDGKALAPLLGSISGAAPIASDFQIGPITYFLAYADHVVTYRFVPLDLLETRCDISWIVNGSAEAGRDYELEDLIWLWDVTTIADKRIIENNQKGVDSRFYTPGPYTPMEEEAAQFISWYLDCLE